MNTYLVTLRFHGIKEPDKYSTRNFKVRAENEQQAEEKARRLPAARSLGSVTLGEIYTYPAKVSQLGTL